ncbi:uncharacterized protein BDR25DRAFT_317915 [Lindgomyces ingoldianus]|uniref:Uncharacterized protein n=1 Tax=Lindgomyces ingoldianus TaxID=673940 RepID=A0ACB6QGK0_9PLEO|nr:uncharacterized protein BDR25DRAFT_317915 [Lindgomyces ingoldianus]KAF2466108.1 hypothetical protein BDR25DRAFT_317915 [Lindgomyces ingoldianus]
MPVAYSYSTSSSARPETPFPTPSSYPFLAEAPTAGSSATTFPHLLYYLSEVRHSTTIPLCGVLKRIDDMARIVAELPEAMSALTNLEDEGSWVKGKKNNKGKGKAKEGEYLIRKPKGDRRLALGLHLMAVVQALEECAVDGWKAWVNGEVNAWERMQEEAEGGFEDAVKEGDGRRERQHHYFHHQIGENAHLSTLAAGLQSARQEIYSKEKKIEYLKESLQNALAVLEALRGAEMWHRSDAEDRDIAIDERDRLMEEQKEKKVQDLEESLRNVVAINEDLQERLEALRFAEIQRRCIEEEKHEHRRREIRKIGKATRGINKEKDSLVERFQNLSVSGSRHPSYEADDEEDRDGECEKETEPAPSVPQPTSQQDKNNPFPPLSYPTTKASRYNLIDLSSTAVETGSQHNLSSTSSTYNSDQSPQHSSSVSLSPIPEVPDEEEIIVVHENLQRWQREEKERREEMDEYSYNTTSHSGSTLEKSLSDPPYIHILLPANFTFSPNGHHASLLTFPTSASVFHFPFGATREQLLRVLEHISSHFYSRFEPPEEFNIMQVRTRVMEWELKKSIARVLKGRAWKCQEGNMDVGGVWQTEGEGDTYMVSSMDVFFQGVSTVVGESDVEFETEKCYEGGVPGFPQNPTRLNIRGGGEERSLATSEPIGRESDEGYATTSDGFGDSNSLFFLHSDTPTSLEGMKAQYHAIYMPNQANNPSWMQEARMLQLKTSALVHELSSLQRQYDEAQFELERQNRRMNVLFRTIDTQLNETKVILEREARIKKMVENYRHPYIAYLTAVREMRDMAEGALQNALSPYEKVIIEPEGNDQQKRNGDGNGPSMRGGAGGDERYTDNINRPVSYGRKHALEKYQKPGSDEPQSWSFIFDVDASAIIFEDPWRFYQWPRNSTLAQIRQVLEYRKANRTENDTILRRIRHIFEGRQELGIPDPVLHSGDRVRITYPTEGLGRLFRRQRRADASDPVCEYLRSEDLQISRAECGKEDEYVNPRDFINEFTDDNECEPDGRSNCSGRSSDSSYSWTFPPPPNSVSQPSPCEMIPNPEDRFTGKALCCRTTAESLVRNMTDEQFQSLENWRLGPGLDTSEYPAPTGYANSQGNGCFFCDLPFDVLEFEPASGDSTLYGNSDGEDSDDTGIPVITLSRSSLKSSLQGEAAYSDLRGCSQISHTRDTSFSYLRHHSRTIPPRPPVSLLSMPPDSPLRDYATSSVVLCREPRGERRLHVRNIARPWPGSQRMSNGDFTEWVESGAQGREIPLFQLNSIPPAKSATHLKPEIYAAYSEESQGKESSSLARVDAISHGRLWSKATEEMLAEKKERIVLSREGQQSRKGTVDKPTCRDVGYGDITEAIEEIKPGPLSRFSMEPRLAANVLTGAPARPRRPNADWGHPLEPNDESSEQMTPEIGVRVSRQQKEWVDPTEAGPSEPSNYLKYAKRGVEEGYDGMLGDKLFASTGESEIGKGKGRSNGMGGVSRTGSGAWRN